MLRPGRPGKGREAPEASDDQQQEVQSLPFHGHPLGCSVLQLRERRDYMPGGRAALLLWTKQRAFVIPSRRQFGASRFRGRF